MSPKNPHVLIVGGGLGGLTLAQCLRKRGISFEIFERDPDWRTSGWCIYIHSSDQGVPSSIIPQLIAGIPDDVPDLARTDHLLPFDLPSQSVVYLPDRPGVRYGVTSRGPQDMIRADRVLLRKYLTTKIPCRMNRRAIAFEESSDSVTVRFEDGTSATGTILVGADGANSNSKWKVRAWPPFLVSLFLVPHDLTQSFPSLVRSQILGPEVKPQVLPLATIGGEVILSGSDFENELRLGHSSRSNFFAEPETPKVPTVHIFSALKRVMPDERSGEYYWFAMWLDETASGPGHWTKSASPSKLHDFITKTTRHISPEFRNIIDLTPVDNLRGSPFPQRALMLPDLPIGRVTLLGDAAHCMPPTRGEAGVHAMRDALNLAECIANIDVINDHGGSSTKKAIGVYQEEMLRRSRVTVQKNIEASRLDPSSMGWGGRDIEPLEEESISLESIGRAETVTAKAL